MEPNINDIILDIWRRGVARCMITLASVNVSHYLAHTIFLTSYQKSCRGRLSPDHGLPARMVKARKYVDR